MTDRFGSTASDTCRPADPAPLVTESAQLHRAIAKATGDPGVDVTALKHADRAFAHTGMPPQPLPCLCTTYCRHGSVMRPPLRPGYFCREWRALQNSQAYRDQQAAERAHEERRRAMAIHVVCWLSVIGLLVVGLLALIRAT